jgi:hypothetical protein
MATTNLQQWNPTGSNMETDAEYAADSQRTGGATDPSIFPSPTGNKVFYQFSTYLTALFTAFANKGFTTSDSNLSTLTAQCANFLTTADFRSNLQIVTYAPTVTFNLAQALGFELQLTGPASITVTTPQNGDVVVVLIAQDSVGGRSVTWSSNVLGPGTIDPTPNSVSVQIFKADSVGHLLPASPMMSDVGFIVGTPIGSTAPSTGGFTTLVTAGLATLQSLTLAAPGSAGQVLTNVGGVFVPQNPAGRVTNSFGSYRLWPDGTLEVWGTVNVPATGSQFATANITYPHNFTVAPVPQLTVAGLPSPSAHANDLAEVCVNTFSTNGATVALQCSVPTGGGGASFDSTIMVGFYAIGN